MIDFHTHILPNVDDGAASLDVARSMLQQYTLLGYSTVVATPHWSSPTDEFYENRIIAAYDELTTSAQEHGLSLLLGRECMLPPDYRQVAHDDRLSINGGRFVLVEVPFGTRPLFMEESIFGLQSMGKVVILAHPERYRFIQQDRSVAKTLVERGVLLQVNIGSLANVFGKSARMTAEALITEGLVHLVATDAHSDGQRLQSAIPGFDALANIVGDDGQRRLASDNPGAILADVVPDPVAPLVTRHRGVSWVSRVAAKLMA